MRRIRYNNTAMCILQKDNRRKGKEEGRTRTPRWRREKKKRREWRKRTEEQKKRWDPKKGVTFIRRQRNCTHRLTDTPFLHHVQPSVDARRFRSIGANGNLCTKKKERHLVSNPSHHVDMSCHLL